MAVELVTTVFELANALDLVDVGDGWELKLPTEELLSRCGSSSVRSSGAGRRLLPRKLLTLCDGCSWETWFSADSLLGFEPAKVPEESPPRVSLFRARGLTPVMRGSGAAGASKEESPCSIFVGGAELKPAAFVSVGGTSSAVSKIECSVGVLNAALLTI